MADLTALRDMTLFVEVAPIAAAGEGHGFAKKEKRDHHNLTALMILKINLLAEGGAKLRDS